MPPFIGCSAYDNLRSLAFFALMNIFLRVVINVLTDVKRQKRINKLQY